MLTKEDIKVYVDNEEASNITKTLTSEEIKAIINDTERVVGHTYTLVLSNFEFNSDLYKGGDTKNSTDKEDRNF